MEGLSNYEHVMDWGLVVAAGTLLITIIGAQWRLSSWLGNQFATIKDLVYENIKEVVKKLEYHEAHDDQRFANIDRTLNEVRLSIAVQNALQQSMTNGQEKRIIRRASRAKIPR